jgi:hypothetical protein
MQAKMLPKAIEDLHNTKWQVQPLKKSFHTAPICERNRREKIHHFGLQKQIEM